MMITMMGGFNNYI